MEKVTSFSVTSCYMSRKLERLHIYETLIYKMKEFVISDLYGSI